MKIRIFTIIIAFITISCETNILGPNEGTVTGNVRDIYNKPVQGASVKITYFEVNKDGNQTEKSITRATDLKGSYIAEVPLAEIGVLISKNGYQEVLFYDDLEQSNPKREFETVLEGNPSVSNFKVFNNPFQTTGNDSLYFSLDISDNYKFKKQEPYLGSLIVFFEGGTVRSHDFEIPFFSSSFKVVNGKVKMDVFQGGDTLKPGTYNLNVIVYDSDNLVSDTAKAELKIVN